MTCGARQWAATKTDKDLMDSGFFHHDKNGIKNFDATTQRKINPNADRLSVHRVSLHSGQRTEVRTYTEQWVRQMGHITANQINDVHEQHADWDASTYESFGSECWTMFCVAAAMHLGIYIGQCNYVWLSDDAAVLIPQALYNPQQAVINDSIAMLILDGSASDENYWFRANCIVRMLMLLCFTNTCEK